MTAVGAEADVSPIGGAVRQGDEGKGREICRFFLRDGYLWKHPKKRNDIPLRVVAMKEE